jgi:hypothetical protein
MLIPALEAGLRHGLRVPPSRRVALDGEERKPCNPLKVPYVAGH